MYKMGWFTGKDASAADIASAHETKTGLTNELKVAHADIADLKVKLSTARIVSSAARCAKERGPRPIKKLYELL